MAGRHPQPYEMLSQESITIHDLPQARDFYRTSQSLPRGAASRTEDGGDDNLFPTVQPSQRRRCTVTGLLATAAGLIVLVLLFGLADTCIDDLSEYRASRWLSGANDTSSKHVKQKTCDDPWAMPGYMWYGKDIFDARWIPYKYVQEDLIVQSFNPEIHTPSMPSAAPRSDRLPVPQYTKMFSQTATRTNNSELEFLRDKHIVFLGNSLDRESAMMFCTAYEGSTEPELEWHHSFVCKWPDFNLTISHWFEFGLSQTEWYHGVDKVSTAIHLEDRVDKIFRPLAEQYGEPDLLIFATGVWDLLYLEKHRQKIDPKHHAFHWEFVTQDELKWHRARLAQAIEFLRNRFPESFLVYRTTAEPASSRGSDDQEKIATFQLNQSARTVMKKLKVPILNWSDLVHGNQEKRDVHHYETLSRANAIYNEQVFYHLKQVSDPTQDTSCWLDR